MSSASHSSSLSLSFDLYPAVREGKGGEGERKGRKGYEGRDEKEKVSRGKTGGGRGEIEKGCSLKQM